MKEKLRIINQKISINTVKSIKNPILEKEFDEEEEIDNNPQKIDSPRLIIMIIILIQILILI